MAGTGGQHHRNIQTPRIMENLNKILKEYQVFKYNWESYTYKEKTILLDDFQERFNQSDNKPLEI